MEPLIVFGVFLLLVIITIAKGIVIVPQGYRFTLERFGQYSTTLTPGLTIIIPYFFKIGKKINMMEQVLDVPSQEVITKDNATVSCDAVVFFQIVDPYKAAYEVTQLNVATQNLVLTNIRTVMGSMDLDELLSNREVINAKLLTVVDDATAPWGVKVTRIEIKDISPPRDLQESMSRQMKAEREKRAEILEAQGVKESQILRAQGQKESEVLRAEGERQAKILQAEADKQARILEAEAAKEAAYLDAEARERAAQAEASATKFVSDALMGGNVQAINYFIAQEYMKALGKFAESDNQKVLMMPLEASSVIGSIAGVADIAKEAFGSSKKDS